MERKSVELLSSRKRRGASLDWQIVNCTGMFRSWNNGTGLNGKRGIEDSYLFRKHLTGKIRFFTTIKWTRLHFNFGLGCTQNAPWQVKKRRKKRRGTDENLWDLGTEAWALRISSFFPQTDLELTSFSGCLKLSFEEILVLKLWRQ